MGVLPNTAPGFPNRRDCLEDTLRDGWQGGAQVQEKEAVERAIARAILATRIDGLRRWLGRLEAHVEKTSLIELETDLSRDRCIG